MKHRAILCAVVLMTSPPALAQQTFRDAQGRVSGSSSTSGATPAGELDLMSNPSAGAFSLSVLHHSVALLWSFFLFFRPAE